MSERNIFESVPKRGGFGERKEFLPSKCTHLLTKRLF
jgi:hypothetical protein